MLPIIYTRIGACKKIYKKLVMVAIVNNQPSSLTLLHRLAQTASCLPLENNTGMTWNTVHWVITGLQSTVTATFLATICKV